MKKDSEIPDWPLILHKLSQANFDFLVVGGGALVLHGIPRTTLDIDIFIPSDSQDINELFNVLKSLNLKSNDDSFRSLSDHAQLLTGQWISFSIPEGPDIIDIYFCRKGEFYSLHESADIIEIKGLPVFVANLNSLKEMKKKSGRPIDLADIALIDEYTSLIDND